MLMESLLLMESLSMTQKRPVLFPSPTQDVGARWSTLCGPPLAEGWLPSTEALQWRLFRHSHEQVKPRSYCNHPLLACDSLLSQSYASSLSQSLLLNKGASRCEQSSVPQRYRSPPTKMQQVVWYIGGCPKRELKQQASLMPL